MQTKASNYKLQDDKKKRLKWRNHQIDEVFCVGDKNRLIWILCPCLRFKHFCSVEKDTSLIHN